MSSSYRDLIAWQKAMDLVTSIYKETSAFPKQEQFGLTAQLRRAAVSIPSNIAEGQAKLSRKEFAYFLRTAKGSLAEVETQIVIAQRLGYMSEAVGGALLKAATELGRIPQWLDYIGREQGQGRFH